MTFTHPEDRSEGIQNTVDEFISNHGEVSFQAQSLTPNIDYVVVSQSLKRDGFWSAEWYDEKGPVHTIELSTYPDLLAELLSNVDVNLNSATFVANAEELESDEVKKDKVGKMLDYANNNEPSITKALQEALEDFDCDNKFGDEAYVFDFDDTLAKTNSKVKVMMGGEVVKELTTHEFAEYVTGPGETLDYSDFNKIVDPKPLKSMKKLIEIDGCISDGTSDAKLYILTARSSQSRFAIFEYLRDSGVSNISERNIITVGDDGNDAEEAARDKAKILEQIRSFHRGNVTFVDDSKLNIDAAKNVDGIDVEHVAGEVQRMIKEGSADMENLVAKRFHQAIDNAVTADIVSEIRGLSKNDMMLFLNTVAYKLLGMSPDNPKVDLNSTLQVVGNLMEKGNVVTAFIYDLFSRMKMKIPQVDADTLIANTVTAFFALSKLFERDNLMAEEVVYLTESILDEPLDRLSPKIWDDGEEPIVIPEVKKFVMDNLRQVIGEVQPTRVYFVGSLTGKRYTEKSDADISVVVDVEEEELEKMKARARKVNGRFPPGTTHPVNYFMLNKDIELDRFDSVYDLQNDKWLKTSKDYGVDFFAVYDDFVEFVSGLDMERGEAFRSIIDIKVLQKALENGGNLEITMNKISQRLTDLNDAIGNLSDGFDKIHKDRVDAFLNYEDGEDRDLPSPNLLPENIRYKLLERFHYLSLMKNIKKLIEKTGDIDTFKDIEDVSDVMSNVVTPNIHDSVIEESLDEFIEKMETEIDYKPLKEEKGKFNNERPLKPIEHPNKDCKDKKKENEERFKDSFDRWNAKATLKIKDNNGAKPEDYKNRNSQVVEDVESVDDLIDVMESAIGAETKTEYSSGRANKQKKARMEGYRVDRGSKGATNVRRMGAKEQLRRKIAAMKGHAKTPACSKATKEKKKMGMELNPETHKQRKQARQDSHKVPPKVKVSIRRKKLREKLKENN